MPLSLNLWLGTRKLVDPCLKIDIPLLLVAIILLLPMEQASSRIKTGIICSKMMCAPELQYY